MLANSRVITAIAVHDLENAAMFYSEILRLTLVTKNSEGYIFESGGGLIALHQSATAGTSQSTCAWWTVEDVEATIKDLKSRGVKFQKNYDLPRAKRKNDMYLLNEKKRAAWFKDPDGNILGIGNF